MQLFNAQVSQPTWHESRRHCGYARKENNRQTERVVREESARRQVNYGLITIGSRERESWRLSIQERNQVVRPHRFVNTLSSVLNGLEANDQ